MKETIEDVALTSLPAHEASDVLSNPNGSVMAYGALDPTNNYARRWGIIFFQDQPDPNSRTRFGRFNTLEIELDAEVEICLPRQSGFFTGVRRVLGMHKSDTVPAVVTLIWPCE